MSFEGLLQDKLGKHNPGEVSSKKKGKIKWLVDRGIDSGRAVPSEWQFELWAESSARGIFEFDSFEHEFNWFGNFGEFPHVAATANCKCE